MTDVKAILSQDAARLDQWLSAHFDQRAAISSAPRLVDAMRYSALNGGKRMRASLVLSAARMAEQLNGQPANCTDLAAVAGHRTEELLKTYAKPTGRVVMPSWS